MTDQFGRTINYMRVSRDGPVQSPVRVLYAA